MTAVRQERLYNLLPALYRNLDEREGQPLRALMAVLESEFRRLEWDTEAMYDDWFIETCDRWVVPYIADLLGVRHLQDMDQIPHQRRLVANSIAYRRRKGTLAVLEQVARDATGWYAKSVEFAQLEARTQHVAYTRPDCGRTVDVRRLQGTTGIDGPFDTLARTLDIDNGDQGRYNAECVGLFFYRLRSYPVRRSFAHRLDESQYWFTFDPLGRDIPLFNQPDPVVHISQRAQPANLPLPLSRADLAADLQAHRAVYGHIPKQFQPDESLYYGPDRSLYIELPDRKPPIKPTAVVSMDLSQWPSWPPPLSDPARAVVAVDVELGRIAFVDQEHLNDQVDIDVKDCSVNIKSKRPGYVIVNYSYGLSGEVGGGPYHREVPLPQPGESLFQINVAQGTMDSQIGGEQGTGGAAVAGCVPTLKEALAVWAKQKPSCGVIRILDNGVYEEELEISLHKGAKLSIVAGNGVRPVIGKNGLLAVVCKDKGSEERWQLGLSGLLVHGGLCIGTPEHAGAAGRLLVTIEHCTLVKGEGGQLKPAAVEVNVSEDDALGLELSIAHSIVGPLLLPPATGTVEVTNSIVDSGLGYAIAAPAAATQPDEPPDRVPGPAVTLKQTTVFGKVSVQKLQLASEVIFTEPVFVQDCNRGGVSFSHVPTGSQTPPRESCQPPDDESAAQVRPTFRSIRFGDPGYAQLSLDCPREIRGGAADGSEMGAFHDLYQLQAEENLQEVLKEYLPLGLQASIRYVT